MANLRTCRNRVLNELYRTGDLTAEAVTAINTAIDYYKRKHFWFNEERDNITTVAGQEYYDLPADFGDIYTININLNENIYDLVRRTNGYMEEMYISANTYTGYPIDYSIITNQLRLGPVPNDANTLELVYRKEPSTATAETDTNFFLELAEPLIRKRAAGDMAASILQDEKRASSFYMMAQDELTNILGESARRTMRGHGRRRP